MRSLFLYLFHLSLHLYNTTIISKNQNLDKPFYLRKPHYQFISRGQVISWLLFSFISCLSWGQFISRPFSFISCLLFSFLSQKLLNVVHHNHFSLLFWIILASFFISWLINHTQFRVSKWLRNKPEIIIPRFNSYPIIRPVLLYVRCHPIVDIPELTNTNY